MSHEYPDGSIFAELADRLARELQDQQYSNRRTNTSAIGGPQHVCGMYCDGQDGPYGDGFSCDVQRKHATGSPEMKVGSGAKITSSPLRSEPYDLWKLWYAPTGSWSERVSLWAENTFGPGTPGRALTRMLEELNELLAHFEGETSDAIGNLVALRRSIEYVVRENALAIRRGHERQAAAESADVAICLVGVVRSLNNNVNAILGQLRPMLPYFDLDNEIELKMNVNRSRKWKSNGDGTGQHIKEPEAVSEVYDERG